MKTVELAIDPCSDEQLEVRNRLGHSRFSILKRSIDARHGKVKVRLRVRTWDEHECFSDIKFERPFRNVSHAEPVYIAGSGPAGLFAALQLIEHGYKPVIIERGKNVRERRRDLAVLTRNGIINPDSNYCFGEGGAGTYSDGKLYTRSAKRGDLSRILNTFILFGASPEINIDTHPHIGTNKLPGIIASMRKLILECGGEFHFQTRLTGIKVTEGQLSGICISAGNGELTVQTRALILATGHSARDIFEMLHRQGLLIEAKPFALGVRVEHPQQLIDSIQYHCKQRHCCLPPASYSLTARIEGRGVYSFCMCPGGIIAPAATAADEVVVNGWSPSKRNNPFANSGMVVTVTEEDVKTFSKTGPLRFLRWQQNIEQRAFVAGGGNLHAPAQRLTDFIEGKLSVRLPDCSYRPGIHSAELNELFPQAICNSLRKGFRIFGKKMKGFITDEAVVVAAESRTSSPVRIPREDKHLYHPQVKGLFPCGEGAGYAGGIVSAAMDGEKCAHAVSRFLSA